MASRDRKQRVRDATRKNIVDAAFKIIKEEGWHKLNMRNVADGIEYTVPVIYEYFAGKNELLLALARKGFNLLAHKINRANSSEAAPEIQLKDMWLAFWDFSIDEKELYQIMFGVKMVACDPNQTFLEANNCFNVIKSKIAELMNRPEVTQEAVTCKFYMFLSFIHGLTSLNILFGMNSKEFNAQILHPALDGIIKTI